MSDPVVALEIGSAKIIALVGERREDGHVMVTGMGEGPSRGVTKGEIVDPAAAQEAVLAAVARAEESGGVEIRRVYVAVSGGHIESLVNTGVVPVLDPDGRIGPADIEKVVGVARAVSLPADRDAIHTICQHYCLDDRQRVLSPEGLTARRLSLDMLVIHAVRAALDNAVGVLEECRLEVADMVFAGLCSGLSVLSPEQKKGGALVLDLGAGTTEYLVYTGGVVAAAGALAVGGDHVTNDLAVAFNIPGRLAERCKRESGSAVPRPELAGQRLSVAADTGFAGRTIPLKAFDQVVHLRVAETLALVRRRLEALDLLPRLAAGVVLVGGGAHMSGIAELASEVFGLPCTTGKPRGISGLATATEGPQYAAAAGLVQYGFHDAAMRRRARPRVTGWLKGFLKRD